MPIFAAYGLLTAVMIAFSLAATLVVLPSLLYLLGPRRGRTAATEEPALATGG
jgi:predicted RND superfamily exporter protein